MSLVLLDIQHRGRPSRPGDRGARGPAGAEADLAPWYALACAERLAELGVPALLLGSGEYPDRHALARRLASAEDGPVAYAACHLNAGGGDYGLVGHDARSNGGAVLAKAVAGPLSGLPELSGVRVVELWDDRAEPHPWRYRGLATLRGIYAGPARLSGVLLEPAFVDTPQHQPLLAPEGLERLGRALAEGLHAWLNA